MRRSLYLTLFIALSISARAQDAQNVTLLCNWNEADTTNNGRRYSGVCGFVQHGKEYAAIGSKAGVYIIDVNTCTQVAYAQSSMPSAINREYKTYKNYLYAVNDNSGPDARLEIYDLQYLPDSMPLAYRSSMAECMNAHTLFIDSINTKLYLGVNITFDSTTSFVVYRDMSVFSLENPIKPKLLCHFEYDQIHDMYVRNDTAYMSASNSGYVVADFSQDTAYTILGAMPTYDYQGYNHSSWINHKGIGVMADETYGMPVKVIRTTDLNNIEVLATFSPRPGDSTCTPHNPYIFNEDYALVAYYLDGLQIYNISKPDSPYRTGYYDTYAGANIQSFAGAWGCDPFLPSHRILVSDRITGLYVFNADTALNLHLQDTVPSVPTVKQFILFPNPAKDKIKMLIPEDGNGQATIFDVAGRSILKHSFYTDTVNKKEVEITLPQNLPEAMYTVRVVMQKNTYEGKFIKVEN